MYATHETVNFVEHFELLIKNIPLVKYKFKNLKLFHKHLQRP